MLLNEATMNFEDFEFELTGNIQLTQKEIEEKRKKAIRYLKRLNAIHNAELPIHKITLDTLYSIFVVAVFESTYPGTTALSISHVCHHWRESALEWPVLWGFVDLNSQKISRLFLERSRDAMITLSSSPSLPPHCPLFDLSIKNPAAAHPSTPKEYVESCVHFLPRLDALMLYISSFEFDEIRPLFQRSGPLRLRCMNIGVTYYLELELETTDLTTKWFQYLSTDASYLRELTIYNLGLPWTIPPHQKLTRLVIKHPRCLPKSNELLAFLSHCPMLTQLELHFWSYRPQEGQANTPAVFERVELPCLTRLELTAMDTQTYLFVREISSRIVVPGPLSSFWMNYQIMSPPITPANILELAPEGTLSHFKNGRYLSIDFHEPRGPFLIHAGCDLNSVPRERGPIDDDNDPSKGFPLSLLGRPNGKIDHSPIVDLIREMPEVRHLQLTRFAWRLWASWNLDVSTTFPHLTTLELSNLILDRTGLTPLLDFRNLKIQTLILKGLKGPRIHLYLLVLSEIASKTGMKALHLESCHIKEREILDVLRKQGINVVLIDDDLDMFNLSLSGI